MLWIRIWLLGFVFVCPVLQAATTVVFLGDSLTHGYGLNPEQAFPALIAEKRKAAGKPITSINAGEPGATSASGPARLPRYLKLKPQVLVLALGANDGLRGLPVSDTEKNLATAIEMAKKNNVKVLLAGIKVPLNYGKKYGADLDALYPRLAKKFNVPLIPFLLEGVGGVPALNLGDGIHPNEKGHQKIAELVLKKLEPLL